MWRLHSKKMSPVLSETKPDEGGELRKATFSRANSNIAWPEITYKGEGGQKSRPRTGQLSPSRDVANKHLHIITIEERLVVVAVA